jgi:hypothetical protein
MTCRGIGARPGYRTAIKTESTHLEAHTQHTREKNNQTESIGARPGYRTAIKTESTHLEAHTQHTREKNNQTEST